jgi:hypothetical protein
MNYLRSLVLCLSAAVLLPLPAKPADVGPGPGYVGTFETLPAAADWATFNRTGAAADSYDVVADVNANILASGVTAQVSSDAVNPPAANANATWSSVGFYLQTRPTGNRYTALMGKFVNRSGTNATRVGVSYLLTIAAGGSPEEEGKGTQFFYSLSGLSNEWVSVPSLNTTSATDGSSSMSANLDINWSSGATLYLLWVDDNATGAQGATDPGNQYDNITVSVTAGIPLTFTASLASPSDNAAFPVGFGVAASASLANGTGPFTVQYFLSSGAGNTTFAPVGSSGSAPYSVNLGSLAAGIYNVYAAATDSAASPATSTTSTNTFTIVPPLTVNLTTPADGASFDHEVSVVGAAAVSGGTPPYAVQFYLNDLANGAADLAAPFEVSFGKLFVGDSSVRATVTDGRGWVSNSAFALIHITGPLGVELTVSNGTAYLFGQSIALPAQVGGGTGPYTLSFSTNGQLAGTITAPPYVLNLGVLPVGSYTCLVHAVDSAVPAGQADSDISVVRVAPNPLTVSLTAPTSGQSVTAGQSVALAATATVGAPLSIAGVEFFYDGSSVGADATAPYAGSVASVSAGNHLVYAIATDSAGRRSFSGTNQITGATVAPGSNNAFTNPIPLSGPIVITTGNNLTANKEFFEPSHGGNNGGASVWWTWTALASGPTTISTEGSDFNTLLGVYTGNAVNQLTTIAGNNDFNGNLWSQVTFNAVGGTLYRIAVDGQRQGGGPFGQAARGNIVLRIQGVGGLTITTPTNGMVLTEGQPIPIQVSIDADFPNPPASRVDFYHAGQLFASSSTPPFSAVATNWPAGSNSFYVVAIDSTGAPIQSGIVNVLVQSVGVTILSPAEDSVFSGTSTNPIPVLAWGYVPNGSITNVDFYVDGIKFGADDSLPFNASWSNFFGGSHRLVAVGTSDSGKTYTSRPVNIGVSSVLLAFNSVWKYLDNNSDQGTAWIAPDFADSSWASGPGPLGYSDSNGRLPATTNSFGPDPNNKYITTYFRQAMVASNVASFQSITLNLERDDGAIIYLNGTELGRFNMPTGAVNYLTFASANAQDDGGTVFSQVLPPGRLLEGVNQFAVEIHQDSTNSSDIWFRMNLVGTPIIVHNLSPLVTLDQPTNGQPFLAPTEIPLAATSTDPDGTVVKVEFFADGVKLGETTNTPYAGVWTSPPIGPHELTALATDDLGGTTVSEPVHIDVYDSVGTPFARVISPPSGRAFEGGTNIVITSYANSPFGVTNVQFFGNDQPIGSATQSPYSIVWDVPFGTNTVYAVATDSHGVAGTSATITLIAYPNTTPPAIARQNPAAGTQVTVLTNLNVVFTEPVHHLDAADLLVNGQPATSVTGSGTTYSFSFPHPLYGQVHISWAPGHGITDFGFPADLPFDEQGAGAQWDYDLVDRTAPTIALRVPAAGATVTNLTQITVLFSEAVTGVEASDLRVNGTPAVNSSGSGSNYIFNVIQPAAGTVNITWATNHGITDLAVIPNAFVGTGAGAWNFTLDTRVFLVQSNSAWNFVKGLGEPSDPMSAWRQFDYDDSGWSNAPAPFFFGDPYTNATIQGTLLSDMNSNYTTVYLRHEFEVRSRGEITNLVLSHQSDDGFIAWLNGVEVWRYNVPSGDLPYNTNATANANEPSQTGAAYITVTLTNAAVSRLVNGRNVLAIQAFNQNLTNAQLYYYPLDASISPPRLVSADPSPGDVFYLTNAVISFSEPVSGVEAADLLVNGVPATGMTTATNTVYSFSFAQPAYGPVVFTWSTNHGIVDFDSPPRAFNAAAPSANLLYTLLNPSSPRVALQVPVAGSVLTGLTAVAVTFTEPVAGVDASDFLVSGVPALSVSTTDNTTYQFTFLQPPFGNAAIRWATNHDITDREASPAPFDPTRFGGQWSYTLIDPVPSVTIATPTNNSYVLAPATVNLRATAQDNDGTVSLVEFYQGADKLGDSPAAPFSLTISNVPVGSYTFRAVATDNIGLRGTSPPVVLNVVTSLPITLVRGPYLQIGSPTGGVVRWRTDLPSDAVVYYGTDSLNLTNYSVQLSVTNEHIVKVSGLEPFTKYYYSIGSSAQRVAGTNGADSEYWFKTSPLAGTVQPVRMWVIGDAGTAGNGPPDRQASTRDAYYNFAATNGPADFWLMLGDNAYNSGTDSEHQAAIFDMYPNTLRNLFLWPTIGNHESAQSFTATQFPYLDIFSLPHDGEAGGVASGTQKYYSFDYANIHFVCLDSMTSGRATNTAMVQWLQDDLAAAKSEWLIAFFHHPPYTRGNHNSDNETELIEIRQNILPILEAYSVDLVLCGHSHAWERSFLLNGYYGLSGTLTDAMKVDGGDGREEGTGAYMQNDEGQGTVYVVAGNAGQVTGGQLNHPAHFLSLNELGSMVIDVNSNRLDAKCLSPAGTFLDTFTLIKRDPRPRAPIELVALPGTNVINLAWTALGANRLGYSVERSLNGVDFTEAATLAPEALSFVDTNVFTDVTYFYRVRGTNESGFGDYSGIASATVVVPSSVPRAPAGVIAASDDGNKFYRNHMIVSWLDRSTNEAAFQIERSTDGLTFVPIATVAANLTEYLDHGLRAATPYYYRVRAVNLLGASGPATPGGGTTHPQSQFAITGQRVVFHAGIEGQPSIGYQWRFQGVAIPGQTNEALVLDPAKLSDEGEYRVVLTEGNTRITSNPAYLLVVAPPSIAADPVDTLGVVGSTASFSALATGTGPLAYRWRHDGVPLEGPSSTTLSLANLLLSSSGSYDMVAENNFGSATSRVARLTVYQLPIIAAVPTLLAEVQRPVVVRNSFTDPNVPKLVLSYSLAPGGPTNARVNPTSGAFSWTPTREYARTTNLFTVRLMDATRPILSNSMSFLVAVNDCIELTVGTTAVPIGEAGFVPIDLFTSAQLLALQCELQLPESRLSNVVVEQVAPQLASVAMQMLGSNSAALTFLPAAGQTLYGTQQLARVWFTPVAGYPSAFLPLPLEVVERTTMEPGLQPTLLVNDGRVAVIGAQPLLDAHFNSLNRRELTVYGNRNVSYTVQQTTNILTGWAFRGVIPMGTNLTRPVPIGNIPAPPAPAWFRAVK